MRRTIVLMELRCSPCLPALLLPSCPPLSLAELLHSCWCHFPFPDWDLSTRSTPHHQLTVQPLPSLFARGHLNTIALHSSSLYHACLSHSPAATLIPSLYFTQILSSLFCHVPLILLPHLSLSVFAVLIVLLFSSLSCRCSEGWRMYLTKLS